VRRELLNNIILVGGGANIDGVGQRLIHELTNMMASNYKVKLTCYFLTQSCNALRVQ
jgi:actin-related protein